MNNANNKKLNETKSYTKITSVNRDVVDTEPASKSKECMNKTRELLTLLIIHLFGLGLSGNGLTAFETNITK